MNISTKWQDWVPLAHLALGLGVVFAGVAGVRLFGWEFAFLATGGGLIFGRAVGEAGGRLAAWADLACVEDFSPASLDPDRVARVAVAIQLTKAKTVGSVAELHRDFIAVLQDRKRLAELIQRLERDVDYWEDATCAEASKVVDQDAICCAEATRVFREQKQRIEQLELELAEAKR